MADALLDDLIDWLRIPSISTGGGDPADLERAAEWAAAKVRDAGGEADLVRIGGGDPLVVGELRAARADAPTVLDLRPLRRPGRRRPGAVELARRSSPRSATAASTPAAPPTTRATSCRCCTPPARWRRAGELPVHVRVARRGRGGGRRRVAAIDWLRADERGADAAIVYDSGMADARTPAITIGLRGIVMCDLRRCAAASATCTSGCSAASRSTRCTSCTGLLAERPPRPRRPRARGAARRRRSRPPRPSAPRGTGCRRATRRWPRSARVPLDPRRRRRVLERNGGRRRRSTSNQIVAGDAADGDPARSRARPSRCAWPRARTPRRCAPTLERLLRAALPEGAELDLDWHTARAGAVRGRRAGRAARGRGARAGRGRRAGPRALRRLDPDRRRARRPRASRRSSPASCCPTTRSTRRTSRSPCAASSSASGPGASCWPRWPPCRAEAPAPAAPGVRQAGRRKWTVHPPSKRPCGRVRRALAPVVDLPLRPPGTA